MLHERLRVVASTGGSVMGCTTLTTSAVTQGWWWGWEGVGGSSVCLTSTERGEIEGEMLLTLAWLVLSLPPPFGEPSLP